MKLRGANLFGKFVIAFVDFTFTVLVSKLSYYSFLAVICEGFSIGRVPPSFLLKIEISLKSLFS